MAFLHQLSAIEAERDASYMGLALLASASLTCSALTDPSRGRLGSNSNPALQDDVIKSRTRCSNDHFHHLSINPSWLGI
jgi:hypothetical protein